LYCGGGGGGGGGGGRCLVALVVPSGLQVYGQSVHRTLPIAGGSSRRLLQSGQKLVLKLSVENCHRSAIAMLSTNGQGKGTSVVVVVVVWFGVVVVGKEEANK
jgi:hypothetical protein